MTVTVSAEGTSRLSVLDGWRGLSIVLVLCGHLLPLGLKDWGLNFAVGTTGIVLFFILSGFLITDALLRGTTIRDFLIKRFCRIVPLAWLYIAIVLALHWEPLAKYAPHLLFYANLPPFYLVDGTAHLWSLCVEVQFYVLIALVCAVVGPVWLPVPLVLACLGITALRVSAGSHASIVTWLGVDQILAGALLAVAFHRWQAPLRGLSARPWLTPLLLLVTACSALEASGPLNYLRPYVAAACVASTLYQRDTALVRLLSGRRLRWLAEISFAVYVIHGGLTHTWLDSGGSMIKYAKRPLMLAVLFLLASLSTRYYESIFMAWGRARTAQGSRDRAERMEVDSPKAKRQVWLKC